MDCREELTERSPLRVLDRSIHGGLGPGNLGVVCGAAGLGKSAFLVGVALDALMRESQVLHVALDQPTERVQAYYDEIFTELARSENVRPHADLWLQIERGLRVQAYQGRPFRVEALERTICLLEQQTGLDPDVVVVDGYSWATGDVEEIRALKALARALRAELWMSASTERDLPGIAPGTVPDAVKPYASLLDVLLQLTGDGGTVHVRLLKDHDHPVPTSVALDLDPATLLLVRA